MRDKETDPSLKVIADLPDAFLCERDITSMLSPRNIFANQ
jgi:hypothetical protein